MTNVEKRENLPIDPTYLLAIFELTNFDINTLDSNDQSLIRYYLGLMADNPKFKEAVENQKNTIILEKMKDEKISLYTDNNLKSVKKQETKNKRKKDNYFQSNLFELVEEENMVTEKIEGGLDPEWYINRLHREDFRKKIHAEDIRKKNRELRNIIGLPVARGKNPHVNDKFYKRLVRTIVKWDSCNIFNEYFYIHADISGELEIKINEVKGFVEEALDPQLNLRQKYKLLNESIQTFNDKWNKIRE